MNMYYFFKTFILFFLCFATFSSVAQEQKTAKQIADSYFYCGSYAKAVPYYLAMANATKSDVNVLLNLAYCYKEMNQYENAEKWYAKAEFLYEKKMYGKAYLYYGEVLQNNKKFEQAKTMFQNYLKQEPGAKQGLIYLASADSVEKWTKNPDKRFSVENAKELNSSDDEWGATYNEIGIVFASNRVASTIDDRSGTHYYKLYYNQTATSSIAPYSHIINQNKYHVGPLVYSKNHDTLYFTRTNVSSGGLKIVTGKNKGKVSTFELELFYQVKGTNGAWNAPVPFKYNNPKEYSVGHAALSSDGSILYLVSDMKGGYGETDIYYCEKNQNGEWSFPVNCETSVNSIGKEMFPTIVNEEGIDYLYFSTDGRATVGGLDIYKVKGKKTTWGEPVNLKIPINSSRDDFHYVTQDNKTGYLSSNRFNGVGGDDIYTFYKTPEEKPKPPVKRIITIDGLAKDKETQQIIDEDYIVVLSNDKTKEETICEKVKGEKYLFEIKREQSYTMKVSAKSYVPQEYFLSFASDTIYAYHKDVFLTKKLDNKKVEEKINFILKNLYYDVNKYNIRQDAALELDKVVLILKEYPNIKLELSSHTDCRSSKEYNMRLSENRAKAAVQYIIEHGIDPSRLVAKGYGETRLVNGCSDGVKCSEEQHQQNRRTEVHIIEK